MRRFEPVRNACEFNGWSQHLADRRMIRREREVCMLRL